MANENEIVDSSKRPDKNTMTLSERRGELVGVVGILLVAAFFVYHQISNTGFFTSAFGPVEAFLFYGAAALAILSSSVRAITGKKTNSRPVELGSAIFWTVTSFWLLIVFPFNFAHLSDALPAPLGFLLSLVSNDVGWVILLLSTLGSIGTAIYTAGKFVGDLRQRRALTPSRQSYETVAGTTEPITA